VLTLTDIKDKFPKVYILGSGPTDFDYEDVSKIDDPIFFINDTVQFEHLCPSPHKFFFSHHLGMKPYFQDVEPVTIFVHTHFFDDTGPDYQDVMIAKHSPKGECITVDAQAHNELEPWFFEKYDWLLDKDEVIKRNRIATGFGSITTLLYMLWFTGCKECLFIGCDPKTARKGFAHDGRIGGKMIYQPELITQNQKFLIKALNLNAEYLYTPPEPKLFS